VPSVVIYSAASIAAAQWFPAATLPASVRCVLSACPHRSSENSPEWGIYLRLHFRLRRERVDSIRCAKNACCCIYRRGVARRIVGNCKHPHSASHPEQYSALQRHSFTQCHVETAREGGIVDSDRCVRLGCSAKFPQSYSGSNQYYRDGSHIRRNLTDKIQAAAE
jgi:hypothetical protein